MDLSAKSQQIKLWAEELGFLATGISKAGFLEDHARPLESFLKKGMHGEMSYLENHFDKRLDPTKLVPGAKSVISLLLNYFPAETQRPDAPKISKYAYGKDYHKVIKKKLKALTKRIQDAYGDVQGRAFVDSAPVLDKAWAAQSGLGWFGKNGNLITKGQGSFYFISELILDLDLAPDGPTTDHCGTCRACLDSCPTQAIVSPKIVDGSKCISYFTIELKNEIPSAYASQLEDWMYGCDVCQDVCPWNKFSKPHREEEFKPKPGLLNKSRKEWEELTEDVFNQLFEGSAVKRTKFSGLKRNLEALKSN